MKQVTVLILAGGIGKRFWPLDSSKSLLPIIGTTLLEVNLKKLVHAGFTKVCIVTTQKDKNYVDTISVEGLTITTCVQMSPNGMAGAVLAARDSIGESPCLIMNATDIVDDDLYTRMFEEAQLDPSFIVGKKVNGYLDVGYLIFNHDHVVGIVEKPGAGSEPSDVVNLVFHYITASKDFFTLLETTNFEKDDGYEVALTKYLQHHDTHCLSYEGYWQPTKYPWQVLDVMEYLLNHEIQEHRGANVQIQQNVIIEGKVYIGDNVKIFENTKITGPCYIGDNTIIGSNNIIRHSYIGPSCVTGFNSDITRSYVGAECWFHTNYIGDSVLESDISMGSGTVLANLRLDEEEILSVVGEQKISTSRTKLGSIIGTHVRLGVNTSIMPGKKIGSHSLVGAGIIIDRDIANESFVYGKSELVIEKNTKAHQKKDRDAFKKKL